MIFDFILDVDYKIDSPLADLKLIPDTIPDFGETLLQSCHCYERALQHQKIRAQRNILKRRLGNVHNELGAFYMNQAEGNSSEFMCILPNYLN